jgi:polyisoprenoid-binding protein YceI
MLKKILLIIAVLIVLFLVFRNVNFSEPIISGDNLDSEELASGPFSNDSEMFGEGATLAVERNENSVSLDTDQSIVTWFGENKIQAKSHTGTIRIADNSFIGLTADEEGADLRVESGYIVVDMTTLSGNNGEPQQLVDHLRSEDFFNVETYNQAQFSVSEATASEVTGLLTIKGKSEKISFPYTLENTGSNVTITGQFTIDRTDWGITTLSGSFFDNVGDAIIEDDVTLTFVLVTDSQ